MTRTEERRLVAALRSKRRQLRWFAKAYGRNGLDTLATTYLDRSDGVKEAILALGAMFEKGRKK